MSLAQTKLTDAVNVKVIYTRQVAVSEERMGMVMSGTPAYGWANSPNAAGRLNAQRCEALETVDVFG